MLQAGRRAATEMCVIVKAHDEPAITRAIWRRASQLRRMKDLLNIIDPPMHGSGIDRGLNRRGNAGRKVKDSDAVDTSEAFKGASTWLAYRWARDYESDLLDVDGNKMKWRFASNGKGSLNEDAVMPGHQAVTYCDGVGARLGITVLEAAIELGFEICLRVPHLSHILQGEDTVNFGPRTVTMQ
eukprot:jgi/Tetstr1/430151/TSEL_019984.t1